MTDYPDYLTLGELRNKGCKIEISEQGDEQ